MQFLVFQLHAPLSSWGEPAVGEFRGTAEHPSRSALLGLLAAALGIERGDDLGHTVLRDGLGIAVGVLSPGSLLRDFHTAQAPKAAALKGRPRSTRRDELSVPKPDLSTILSSRDYRQDAASVVAIVASSGAKYSLESLEQALRRPAFVLYLGRKSCPPAAPLWPHLIEAESAREAFERYAERFDAARGGELERLPKPRRIAFDDAITAGVEADLHTTRKDRVIRRDGWLFGDRQEHVALLGEET